MALPFLAALGRAANAIKNVAKTTATRVSNSIKTTRKAIQERRVQRVQQTNQVIKEFSSDEISRPSSSDNSRKTKMQESYFKRANLAEGQITRTAEQKLIRQEQTFFYAKTRHLWEGGSPAMRNDNIVSGMQDYGLKLSNGQSIENLADAVQWVKENYSKDYPTLSKAIEGRYDTENDPDFNEEVENETGSPPSISKEAFARYKQSL